MSTHPQVQTYTPVKAARAYADETAELLPQKFTFIATEISDAEEMSLVEDFAGIRWLIRESDLYPVKYQ